MNTIAKPHVEPTLISRTPKTMTRISLELVPRSEEKLITTLDHIKANFDEINVINIPDLLKFPIRSWEGCKIARSYYRNTIPHIRAIDFDLDADFPLTPFLEDNDIKEILVIKGDESQDMRSVYPTTSVELIKKIKKEVNGITVYAAIDSYRSGINQEFEYIKQKIDAGADGFFTQPFFDLRLMEIYAEKLENHIIFWGVNPVISQRARQYWEFRNRVYFPVDFETNYHWNITLARRIIRFCKTQGFNIYLMPIKIDLKRFLEEIFK
ncbi:MAG: methylenetetrahydrofolate reductase [Candidatus Aminicenantes bacterium]|jgi:methylenetetrahydrofolate reductase (NADPH)